MTTRNLEANYFKIGFFVLIGISVIILALLAFGSSKLLRRTVYIETYFDESIQGITEGSPVKYRGLQIGYVKEIAFTNEIYHKNEITSPRLHSRSIYVKIAITSKLFTHLNKDELERLLTDEVASGLRVKLEAQGLTGITYLEFNYVDPKNNPPPEISWKPEYFFVPSATSTFNMLSKSMRDVFLKLKDVDLKGLTTSIEDAAHSVSSFSHKAEDFFDHNDLPLETTLWNLKNVSDNLRILSEQLNFYPTEIIFGKEPPLFDPSKL
ncbi:MAG: MlaD family protein [Gammaproteobacteria bacterium]|nr:MlaD family protein [Gammaproteobacteria bacterium]